MNVWKPLALLSTAALGLSVGYQAAFAHDATSDDAIQLGVCHDQPNMAGAVAKLHEAKGFLEKAEHNKGGWRVAAIEATNKAIAETDRGCAFADTH